MKIVGVSEWKLIEHDSDEHADYFERKVLRDDGSIVIQVAVKGDGLKHEDGKMNNSPLTLHHQFIQEVHLQPRPITKEEKERAVKMRGRGLGVEPSNVIYSLENQGVYASVSGDVDGGLGVVDV